ncbi:MAG TPA: succinate dehydrogenase, hydrophobic membrane anchor protein [Rhodospirillales bacterium]|jgi:succinate dehydrogenase / fumarate reductase membrane anchor subunit|nr:succinate dehydrogenase, hydrophobic membrane anchor protein [Rhodospirillales bacterium]|tara:strand:- start:193 stop:573 length:381 start_codon:yes stop_codon:yes gene_type:complete
MEMRSSLGRVQGLGSAKEGVGHWWAQRLTSVALVPLVLWFMFSVVFLADADHAIFKSWVGSFGNGLLLVLLIVALFHHAQLGLQVVIEDYVHGETAKMALLIAVKFSFFFLGAASVSAVLHLAFGN